MNHNAKNRVINAALDPQLNQVVRNFEASQAAWRQIVQHQTNAMHRLHTTTMRLARQLGLNPNNNNVINDITGIPRHPNIRGHPNYRRNHQAWLNAHRAVTGNVGGHRARMLNRRAALEQRFGPGPFNVQLKTVTALKSLIGRLGYPPSPANLRVYLRNV